MGGDPKPPETFQSTLQKGFVHPTSGGCYHEVQTKFLGKQFRHLTPAVLGNGEELVDVGPRVKPSAPTKCNVER